MGTVISFINLKGGVAKTTTLVQLAEALAFVGKKRVLVIDLDPQTNATLALIGEQRWEEVDDTGQTVAQMFLDRIHGETIFDLQRAVLRGVSNLYRIKVPAGLDQAGLDQMSAALGRIDLLPSSIQLINAQDRMNEIPVKSHYTVNPMEVLSITVQGVLKHYDYILIDCPPNLGYITKNGLEISDYYLIPTIPDRLSTHGIAQIVETVADLARTRHLKIQALGVLMTKVETRSGTHTRGIASLPGLINRAFGAAGLPSAPLMSVRMPQATRTSEAMNYDLQFSGLPNFKDKYGREKRGDLHIPLYDYPVYLMHEIETLIG